MVPGRSDIGSRRGRPRYPGNGAGPLRHRRPGSPTSVPGTDACARAAV